MENKIKTIIKKEFKAKVEEITRITEGYSHFMYSIKINKLPREVILRFSNNTEPKSNLAKEKFIIDILRKNKIPAPKILAFHLPDNKKDGYMIIEKFQGERLDTIWEGLSKEEKILITKKMGKVLQSIHSIKFDKFGIIEEGGRIETEEDFKFRSSGDKIKTNQCQKNYLRGILIDLSILMSHDSISKSFLEKYTSYIIRNKHMLKHEGEASLVHGDFMPGHIFAKKIKGEYKIIGIIDFEFAASWNPEHDFIKLHRLGFLEMPELMRALEEGYGKRINEAKVLFQRIMRDCAFATYILEAGNSELSKKVLKNVEEKINQQNNQEDLTFFNFP